MSSIPGGILTQISGLLQVAPVDVSEVAERLGLAIYESELGDGISGAVIHDPTYGTDSEFVILVDDSEAYVRQRFTSAHEIGHYVLHKDDIKQGVRDNYLLRAEGMSNWKEVQANRFAADLLMPFDLINTLIQDGKNSVTDLAQALGVSEIAMGIRLGHPT